MPHHGNLCAVEHDDVDTVAAPAEKQMHAVVSYYLAKCNGHTKLFNCNILFHNKGTHKYCSHLSNEPWQKKKIKDFWVLILSLGIY